MNKQIQILWKNEQQKEDFSHLHQQSFSEVTKNYLWRLAGYLIFGGILWGCVYGFYRWLAYGY